MQHRARLHPAVHADLVENAGHVNTDSLLADVQPVADLAISQALGHLAEDLELAGGEASS